MRASSQEQTGGAGASEVTAKFERINWGVAENSRHDLGTDLFLMARDDRRFDLGLMVGAQVKTGPSYFREPVRGEAGDVTGWWFRDSGHEHFDAWLAHQLPHIIVLHDLEESTSYWAQVTEEAVAYQETGAKIFIPRSNTIDRDHADALLAVAASKTAPAGWEGSAWRGAEGIKPRDRLRFAMLAPRMVAPHGNRGTSEGLTPPEALALIVQGRDDELLQYARTDENVRDGLDSTAAASPWRIVSALRAFLLTGRPEIFSGLAEAAQEPSERAAAAVAHASALLEDCRPADAVAALREAGKADDLGVVDHAWVQLQLARALREVGHHAAARSTAVPLIDTSSRAPGEPTAAAISGAAANMVFSMADLEDGDLARTIEATDNTLSWWRQQTISWGLDAQADSEFKRWARDRSTTWRSSNPTWNRLRSSMLTAGFLGDHSAWRRSAAMLARYLLVDPTIQAADTAVAGLDLLRQAGDHKPLELALRQVTNNGPCSSVAEVVARVDLRQSTTTSIRSDLAILARSGDYASPQQAAEHVRQLMHHLEESGDFNARFSPGFLPSRSLLDALAGTCRAADPTEQRASAKFLLKYSADLKDGSEDRVAAALESLPDEVWTAELSASADSLDLPGSSRLSYAVRRIAALYVSSTREQLLAEACEGSQGALGALGDVRKISDPHVARIIASLAALIDARLEKAESGEFEMGHDLAFALAILNVWHPMVANWELLTSVFERTTFGDYVERALRVCADRVDKIPEPWRDRLGDAAERIAAQPDPPVRLLTPTDARPSARRLYDVLGRSSTADGTDQLPILAAGDVPSRREAATIARYRDDERSMGLLLVLAGDSDPGVRAETAAAFVQRALRDDDEAAEHALRMLDDTGELVSLAVAQMLPPDSDLHLSGRFDSLKAHPSAAVRDAYGEN